MRILKYIRFAFFSNACLLLFLKIPTIFVDVTSIYVHVYVYVMILYLYLSLSFSLPPCDIYIFFIRGSKPQNTFLLSFYFPYLLGFSCLFFCCS